MKSSNLSAQSRAQLIAMVAMIDERYKVVLATDGTGRIICMNPFGERLTGWRASEPEAVIGDYFEPLAAGVTTPDEADGVDALLASYGDAARFRVANPAVEAMAAPAGADGAADGGRERGAIDALIVQDFAVKAAPVYGPDGGVGAVWVLSASGFQPYLVRDIGKMLQIVIDNIPQFVFWKDVNLVYLGCNRNFAKVAGLESHEDIVGKTDFELPWRRQQAEQFREVDRRVIESGVPERQILETQLQADGKDALLETNKIPLRDETGRVVGLLGTYADVTEQRDLEEQLRHAQKMKAIGQLAGGIAHDFNNLLTAIACHAELALHAVDVDGPAYADLQQILHAIRHAADLTQQLLTFSRRRVVQQKLIRVNDVVMGISTMLRPLIRANAEMATLLAATAPVRMDPGELEQVIVNLVVNASNAMPDGGTLTIATRDQSLRSDSELPHGDLPLGDYVNIQIQDTGTGMTTEVRERIFEPFFTTKGPGEGTGLGLAIVYGIVTRAGGYIHVDSELGEGTTFGIWLPVAESDGNEVVERAPRKAYPRGTETVLLVEDEAALRHLAERILGDLGYTIVAASNGEEALRVAAQYGPDQIDLLLTDVVMPVMGGTELVERFRGQYPDVKILFMSGYTGTAGVDRYLDENASFLQKPFTLEVFTQRVREVLDEPAKPAPVSV
ncbi:MAG: hypothetical protein Tsb0020_35290 [Haliangiales bacterium]